MKTLIIFDTQSGTTQFVADILMKELQALGHTAATHQVSVAGEPKIEEYDSILIGAPTYNNGEVEFNMGIYIAEAKPDLSQKKVAVFALGDSSFDHYCTSAEILTSWVTARGATPVIEALKIDGFPGDQAGIKSWVKLFVDSK